MDGKSTESGDRSGGLRIFLLLDAVVRSFIWAASLVLTWRIVVALGFRWDRFDFDIRPIRSAWGLTWAAVGGVVLYNALYVLILVFLRLPIPTPKEGRYSIRPGGIPDRNVQWSCFCAVLTKARYHAPFPGFLVFHMANLPPWVWLMGPIFGPKSRSCYVVDPKLLDPHLTQIGRNVTIGYGTIIAAHSQERDEVVLRRTIIEDDVLIGGNCIIYGGCRIRRGAAILSGAVVQPDTEVGENEMWGGLPARKIKDLPAVGADQVSEAERAA